MDGKDRLIARLNTCVAVLQGQRNNALDENVNLSASLAQLQGEVSACQRLVIEKEGEITSLKGRLEKRQKAQTAPADK